MREPQEEEAIEPERPGEMEGIESSTALEEQAPQARSRFASFMRKALLWVVILLLAVGSGALAVYWYLYRPLSQELEQTRSQVQQAQQQIAELEVYQSQNEALREEQRQTNIQVYILRALSDVNAARLALATEDAGTARDALSNTGRDLRSLANLVGPDQRSQLAAMQERLQLALNEMNRDAFAAQSDLGVLEANLRQLEAALVSEE
jgi:hypothetical protein